MGSTSDSVTASPALPLTIICTQPFVTNWSTAPFSITSPSDRLSVLLPVPVRSTTSTELSFAPSATRSSVWLAPVRFRVSSPPLPAMPESLKLATAPTLKTLLPASPFSTAALSAVSVNTPVVATLPLLEIWMLSIHSWSLPR
ncbi:hypothetical protein D9M68_853880 [compost metagenome]